VPQKEVELILARQLASYLAIPIFLVDPAGTLLYFNEPAEGVLGLRFEDTGTVPMEEWASTFIPRDEHGAPLPPDDLPLVVALRERHPAHRRFFIRGMDGVLRHIDATAIPLFGQAGRCLGGMAIFWEVPLGSNALGNPRVARDPRT
jgi:PAS domain-containing protein